MARIEDGTELLRLLEPGEQIVATMPALPVGWARRLFPLPSLLGAVIGGAIGGAIGGVIHIIGMSLGPLAMGLAFGVAIAVAVMFGRRSTASRQETDNPDRYQLAVTDRYLYIGSVTKPSFEAVATKFRRVPLVAISGIDITDRKLIGLVNGYQLTLMISNELSPFVALLPLDNSRKNPRKERFLQALRSPASLGSPV
jgi:hypothetical protein